MGMYHNGDVVTRLMTIRKDGVLTDADVGLTATLFVNGTASATVVTIQNISTGEYKFTYTVPVNLLDADTLSLKVVGVAGEIGFTEWIEDQYTTALTTGDFGCIADWVLRQPCSAAETSVCTDIPANTSCSLLYLVKNLAPNSSWFTTIVQSAGHCNCGSITCASCGCH